VKILTLRAADIEGPFRWRWLLSSSDEFLADWPVDFPADAADRHTVWLGRPIMLALRAADAIRVEVPREARFILDVPLHLVGIKTPITYHFAVEKPRPKDPAEDRVRILALPGPGTGPSLEIRREQQDLDEAAAARAHLRVLPSRPTRDQVYDAVEDYPGWDVLHLSTHGTAEPGDLIELLGPMRDRLKLVVLSVCRTDAEAAATILHRLDLPAADPGGDPAGVGPGWCLAVADELGAGVVAMRRPAPGFTSALYRALLDGRVLQDAVTEATVASGADALLVGPGDGLAFSPAADRPPQSAAALPGFPPRPQRFVGRADTLLAAARRLSPDSGRTGLLLVGVGGVGKTACALEIAYDLRDWFETALWWSAPPRGDRTALHSLAFALEHGLGVPAIQALTGDRDLDRFLPHLRATLRGRTALIVLDNLETQLDAENRWRDPRMGRLVAALTDHGGPSRTILTSRCTPADLPGSVQVKDLSALSLDESLLLARELPKLGRIIASGETGEATGRGRLVRQVLEVVRGHPKLLELIDATSSDPASLAERLQRRLDTTDPQHRLTALFPDDEHTEELHEWVRFVLTDLPEPARLLVDLLAELEPVDRTLEVVWTVWPRVWQGDGGRGVPPREVAIRPLVRTGLVEEPSPGAGFRIHAGVAGLIRAEVSAEQKTLINTVVGEHWSGQLEALLEAPADGADIPECALRGVPYHARAGDVTGAVGLLRQVDQRDRSPAVTQRVIDHLRQILTDTPEDAADPTPRLAAEALQAQILNRLEPVASVQALTALYQRINASNQPQLSITVAGDLATAWCERGRFGDALRLLDTNAARLRQTNLGAWTRASNECHRLFVIAQRGDSREALDGAVALLKRLWNLPTPTDGDNNLHAPWHVQESTLRTAYLAAVMLREWAAAQEFNGQILRSLDRRGAGRHERAWVQFNAYAPLLRLGQADRATELLEACQQTFEVAMDMRALGAVLSARAELADHRGAAEQARDLEHAALRLKYFTAEPDTVAASHHNLANYLTRSEERRADRVVGAAFAHRIAAGLLLLATERQTTLRGTVHGLAVQLDRHGPDRLPRTLDSCASRVHAVEGVQFTDLLQNLVPNTDARAELFERLLRLAREEAARDVSATVDNHPTLLVGP
jgi:hypothetical protein